MGKMKTHITKWADVCRIGLMKFKIGKENLILTQWARNTIVEMNYCILLFYFLQLKSFFVKIKFSHKIYYFLGKMYTYF